MKKEMHLRELQDKLRYHNFSKHFVVNVYRKIGIIGYRLTIDRLYYLAGIALFPTLYFTCNYSTPLAKIGPVCPPTPNSGPLRNLLPRIYSDPQKDFDLVGTRPDPGLGLFLPAAAERDQD